MTFITYSWQWLNNNVNIRTFQGKEAAVQKALAYFPGDQVAIDFITQNQPTEMPDPEPVTTPPVVEEPVTTPVVAEEPVATPVVAEEPRAPI